MTRPLALVNVTITDNESGNFGGGLGIGGAAVPVTMVNTIVAKNRVRGVAAHHDCSGTVTSEGYNLIGVSTGCTMAGDLTGVLLDENPRLFPLADNGGPTLTHALRPASPAIDSGDTALGPAFDQRGVARPQAKRPRLPAITDMGACEFVRSSGRFGGGEGAASEQSGGVLSPAKAARYRRQRG